MGTKASRKVYSKEFKSSAVAMVTEQGHHVASVARDLGINEQLLHKWKRALQEQKGNAFPGNGNQNAKELELKRLKRENARLKEECEILKKAAAFFMLDPG